MGDKKVTEYPGETMDVQWDARLCIHIGECGRASGDLFVGGRQPWCQPDAASDDEVVDVVQRCPTGALSFHAKRGVPVETAPPDNTVQVAYNGPLFVRGELVVDGAKDDMPGTRFRVALCRCGKSASKPFCDNSHIKADFQDFGAVGEAGTGLSERGGPLTIKAAKDGPLLVKGNVSIAASSGRKAWQGDRVALCRCGASANKPFCDGSHKKVGFVSD